MPQMRHLIGCISTQFDAQSESNEIFANLTAVEKKESSTWAE